MASVELTTEQVIALVRQLPSEERRNVLLALAADSRSSQAERMAKGKPYDCLALARSRMVDGVTCAELLDELTEKLRFKASATPRYFIRWQRPASPAGRTLA